MAPQVKGSKYLLFNGRLAKNIRANLNTKATPRQVKQYADKETPRCVVNLYLSLKPAVGCFYRRPLPVRDGKVVFSAHPVGVNKLAMYLSELFKAAGISDGRNITGHNGKVTCYTQLYSAGFDEQSIMKRSGHRSSVVRLYKRPSLVLEQQVSAALQPPRPKSAPPSATIVEEEMEALPTPTEPPKKAKQSPSDTLQITVPSCIKLFSKMEKVQP